MLDKPVTLGQDVAIRYPGFPILYKIEAVKYITPGGQIVLENHERYTHDGYEFGKKGRARRQLEHITPAIKEAVRRDDAQKDLRYAIGSQEDRDRLTTDQLATLVLATRFPVLLFEVYTNKDNPLRSVHLRRVSLRRAPPTVKKGRDFAWRLECGMMHMDRQGEWQIASMNSKMFDHAFMESFFFDTPEEANWALELHGTPAWEDDEE